MTRIWLCIDGLTRWLLCTVVPQPTAGLCTFTLDFYGGQTLTVDGTGAWSAQAATGGTDQVFLQQQDFALITPMQPPSPTSAVFGFKTVPYTPAG